MAVLRTTMYGSTGACMISAGQNANTNGTIYAAIPKRDAVTAVFIGLDFAIALPA